MSKFTEEANKIFVGGVYWDSEKIENLIRNHTNQNGEAAKSLRKSLILVQKLQEENKRLREALEFFANEQLYKMSSFQTASPIHDVDKPTNITVNENPILYLGLEKARIALNPGSKGGG